MTPEQTATHIRHKMAMGELRSEVGHAMLALLQYGVFNDYQALYKAVTQVPLGKTAYHTAPVEFRGKINAQGLKRALPADGPWNINAGGQPLAVYVALEPDLVGRFALTDAWDIWEIDTEGLPWEFDQMNEGCYAILQDIPREKIRLLHAAWSPWVRPSARSAS